jgi:DNA gyrase/topoisomerase IV subunit A
LRKKVSSKNRIKPGSYKNISINNFAFMALRIYGSYVVEDRAVPELRDGLKPVHRALLWAMNDLSLSYTAKFRKSAKVVGDTIGSYHPHGDSACYEAMVNLANLGPKLVRGEGNWGSPVDSAAHYRYTESRLSVFSTLFLLDKGYLNAVRMQPNFDNTAKIPVHLPALLPVMLLMGNPTAPAYGIRAGNPPFSLDGVVDLVVQGLKGKPIESKDCAKLLKIEYPYGGVDLTTKADFFDLVDTGKGSMTCIPEVEAVWSHKHKDGAKKILIKSYSLGFRGDSVKKQLDRINAIPNVLKAYDRSGKKDKYGRAGPYGCLYVVEPKRGITEDSFYDLFEIIQKILTTKEPFDLGCTIKKIDKVNFVRPSVPQFLQTWVRYRIKLEKDYLIYLIGDAESRLSYQELLLFAVDNRDKLLKLFPVVLKHKSPDESLAKALQKPLDFAKAILDLRIRRLASLERQGITIKIKEIKSQIKSLGADLKNPNPRILSDLRSRVAKYKELTVKYDKPKR